jgi:hypothetical protein
LGNAPIEVHEEAPERTTAQLTEGSATLDEAGASIISYETGGLHQNAPSPVAVAAPLVKLDPVDPAHVEAVMAWLAWAVCRADG